jgi:hypothetical protein
MRPGWKNCPASIISRQLEAINGRPDDGNSLLEIYPLSNKGVRGRLSARYISRIHTLSSYSVLPHLKGANSSSIPQFMLANFRAAIRDPRHSICALEFLPTNITKYLNEIFKNRAKISTWIKSRIIFMHSYYFHSLISSTSLMIT